MFLKHVVIGLFCAHCLGYTLGHASTGDKEVKLMMNLFMSPSKFEPATQWSGVQ